MSRELAWGWFEPCPGVGLPGVLWRCRVGWRVLWLDIDARLHTEWTLIRPHFIEDRPAGARV